MFLHAPSVHFAEPAWRLSAVLDEGMLRFSFHADTHLERRRLVAPVCYAARYAGFDRFLAV
jgi:hypothetical protein